MPISLQAALYGAITQNPDLVALRNSNIASAESVEVARRFPTTLNPTIWTQIRPWVWGPNSLGKGYGAQSAFIYVSWRQPVELGHQTTHRYGIAKAAYSQQQWTVIQAELLAMVQSMTRKLAKKSKPPLQIPPPIPLSSLGSTLLPMTVTLLTVNVCWSL